MSAIAGILCLDRGATEADPAERMAEARAWRGPDDDGSYRSPDGRAALAARRLATIDGSDAASQPLANETHDIWLVLDGEILNHRTLRHSLELVGHRFRSASDAEVALHAYEQWDLDFLGHLQGSFALGLWDDRRDRLVLARDRLGRKPLFLAEHRGRLGFASGIGPLLDELALPRRLDPAGLAAYLALGVVPAPATLVSGVTKLAPGEMLVADRAVPPRRQRWHPPGSEERRAMSVRGLPADRHAGNLRTLLECAVADRLIGDMPAGLWLTPSAAAGAIAAIATRLTGRAPVAVSVAETHDAAAAVETRHLAEAAGIEPVEVAVGADEFGAALPGLIDRLAEPVAHSNVAAGWFAAAALQGARVNGLLADIGSEELLLCQGAYGMARPAGMVRRLANLWRPKAGPEAGAPAGLRPFADRRGCELLSIRLPPHETRPALAGEGGSPLGLGDLLLRVGDGLAPGLDGMAQAQGLEARLPFLDDALVSYALSVPRRVRAPAGGPRQMLRRMLGDLVPAATLARTRAPVNLPVGRWLAGPLSGLVDRLPDRWAPLDAQAVRALADEHRASLGNGEALWALLLLAEWCAPLGLTAIADDPVPQAEMAHSRS